MTEFIQQLLRACNLIITDYDRTPAPFQKKTRHKQRKIKSIQTDSKISYDSTGRPWKVSEGQSQEIQFDRVESQTQRSDKVTQQEITAALSAGLNEKKYKELKPFWAKGLGAVATARTFNGRHGYGARTLEKYWAQFNSLKMKPK